MKLNSKVYDILKLLCTVILPAVSACYVGLANVWGWPLAEQVAQTLAIICTFIGALIGISSHNYWKDVEKAEDQE